MANIKITLIENQLREGEFPIEDLLEIDPEMKISINKTDMVFKKEIVIEFSIPDDEDVNSTIFALGRLVGTIKANRYK